MPAPQRVKTGDEIFAKDWNAMVDMLGGAEHHGGHGGATHSSAGASNTRPGANIRLVEAIARAQTGESSQPNPLGNNHQVWSQRCRFVKIDIGSTGYEAEAGVDEFIWVYFPTHLRKQAVGEQQQIFDYAVRAHVSWSAGYKEGERFWAIYNEGSGRWESLGQAREFCRIRLTSALSAGGQASAKAVYSTVDHAEPAALTDEFTVWDWIGNQTGSVGDHGYAFRFTDLGRWEVIIPQVSGSVPDGHKMLYLCKTTDEQITVDAETPIKFQGYTNFSLANHEPVSFDAGASLGGVWLKRTGYYLFGYDVCWDGPTTSAGGGTVTVAQSVGTVYLGAQSGGVGTVTALPCSTQQHEYTKIKTIADGGANITGNAHKTTLYRNTDDTNIVRLYTQGGSATHNRFFLGNQCSLWVRYLHDLSTVVSVQNL